MGTKISLLAPISGRVVSLEEVPDPVFSQKMMGDGLAIEPESNILLAPCDGEIMHVFPTKHALGILTNDGLEILIHIGLDTVNLNGKGFKSFVEENQKIIIGQKLIELDIKYLKKNAKSLITPIIITNMDRVSKIVSLQNKVIAHQDIFMEIELK
ncbi:MAG TPA: PTS glucose transporter subunit IIA [Haloplasmataceae bacterium]